MVISQLDDEEEIMQHLSFAEFIVFIAGPLDYQTSEKARRNSKIFSFAHAFAKLQAPNKF